MSSYIKAIRSSIKPTPSDYRNNRKTLLTDKHETNL